MSLDLGHRWRVLVVKNLVTAILPAPASADDPPEDDPLKVSTQLAMNNIENGCLDGNYDFNSFENARHFASLCAGYFQNLSERTIVSLSNHDASGTSEWKNQFLIKGKEQPLG